MSQTWVSRYLSGPTSNRQKPVGQFGVEMSANVQQCRNHRNSSDKLVRFGALQGVREEQTQKKRIKGEFDLTKYVDSKRLKYR